MGGGGVHGVVGGWEDCGGGVLWWGMFTVWGGCSRCVCGGFFIKLLLTDLLEKCKHVLKKAGPDYK